MTAGIQGRCTPFLDFSTRQRRLVACQREVELNRRLAPDVYLGVADVTGVDGHPCDHLVVMRRMPEDRRLATLLSTGSPLTDQSRQLARMLTGFHARARRAPEITTEGGRMRCAPGGPRVSRSCGDFAERSWMTRWWRSSSGGR